MVCVVQAMQFWRKAERVVQYKQQVVTNARKKEVMDKHLDFLVGQTQRYSTLLAQRLAGMLPLLCTPTCQLNSSDLTFVVAEAQ